MEYKISKILSQDGSPFIEASDGGIEFGIIRPEQNLFPAPIRLVLGNADKGLLHVIKRHGDQIHNAGYESVVTFVEFVAKNFNRILLGKTYKSSNGMKNQSYLIQLTDNHNNTLWVQLSQDKTYWNVNSAGVLSKRYGNNKENIWSASEVQNSDPATTENALQYEPNADDGPSSNGAASNVSGCKNKYFS